MIRCLIADDEVIAHQILEQYILQTPGLVLVGNCRNALEVYSRLEQQPVDLLFLDIEMPLLNGINFLKTLSAPPKVILTTAYAAYALEGYELNVVDYLLKPFSFERFSKAVDKVQVQPLATVVPVVASLVEKASLLIKEKEGWLKIAHADILYIEASRDYMKIFTAERQYLTHLTMKRLEEVLPAGEFVRTHKSYMVALGQIRSVKTDNLLLGNEVNIPVSDSYRAEVMERFRNF